MAEQHDIVAIIPAKSVSKRLPGKNIMLFRGLPLFVWSVLYAHEEGVQPVVVTDSELVGHIAHGFGAIVYPQTEEQFDNYDSIPPIIEDMGVKKMVLLQATSPLRQKGALKEALSLVPELCPSCYTANKIKLHGHWNGKFVNNMIATGGKSYFNAADGNIFCCTSEYFLAHNNYFIGDESFIIPNEAPYTTDINTQEEFDAAESLAIMQPELLVHPIKSIAVVQNQRILKRNYTDFIDSCDLVVRNGTMDNLDTGRAGTRTDIHFAVDWGMSYIPWMHPDDRHLKEANEASIVFQYARDDEERQVYPYGFGYVDRYRGPFYDEEKLDRFTTKARAVYHMHYTFPDATIYNLGTHRIIEHLDRTKRTGRPSYTVHDKSHEERMMDEMVEKGSMVDILEEDLTEEKSKYSTIPTDGKPLPVLIMVKGRDWEAPFYLYPDKERVCTKCAAVMPWAKIEKWEPKDELIVRSGYDNRRHIFKYNPDRDVYATYDSYPDIEYTHVFALGEDCTSSFISKKYFYKNNGYGPFDFDYMLNIREIAELIYARGAHTADAKDIARTQASDGTYILCNKRTHQCFPHIGNRTSENAPVTQEDVRVVQDVLKRRWERLLEALDTKDNKVLFIYVDFGSQYRQVHSTLDMFYHGANPARPETDIIVMEEEMRKRFKADIAVLYIKPGKDAELPAITYRDTHTMVCEHSQVVITKPDTRAENIYNELASYFRAAFRYVGDNNAHILKSVRHKDWTDDLVVYAHERMGHRGLGVKGDEFTVLEYEPNRLLKVYWDNWLTKETFEKKGDDWVLI